MDWRDEAACRGKPPEWWHIVRGGNYLRARAICSTCPVRGECLKDAMDYEARNLWSLRFGMYGGLTPEQREDLAGGYTAATPPRPLCGAEGGYYRHLRAHDETPCPECKAAHARKEAERVLNRQSRREAIAS